MLRVVNRISILFFARLARPSVRARTVVAQLVVRLGAARREQCESLNRFRFGFRADRSTTQRGLSRNAASKVPSKQREVQVRFSFLGLHHSRVSPRVPTRRKYASWSTFFVRGSCNLNLVASRHLQTRG